MKTVAFIRGTGIYDDSRSTKEIAALVENGYKVYILGWDRDGRAQEKCREIFGEYGDALSLYFYNVRVPNGLGMKNIGKLLGWIRWIKKTLFSLPEVEIVHACDLDTGIAAKAYCKKTGKKLIYDIFDYYIDTHTVPGPLRSVVERMEIGVINRADVTIICTEERTEQIAKATPRKLAVIHNSPDVDVPPASAELNDYAYCGSLSDMRLLSEIFDLYGENRDIKMITAGYGKHSARAAELSEANDGFTFLGSISYSDVLKVESESRVLSAIYEPTIRNHRLCAPNKFYEALALGKPLIVCRGTGIDKVVEENDIGAVIDYDAHSFYEALRRLLSDDKVRAEMGERARALYEEKYRWSQMKGVLLSLYSEI